MDRFSIVADGIRTNNQNESLKITVGTFLDSKASLLA